MSVLLISVYKDGMVGEIECCDYLRWVGRSFVLEWTCLWEGIKSSKDGKAPWV